MACADHRGAFFVFFIRKVRMVLATAQHQELCLVACKWLKKARNQYDLPKSGAACTFAISEVSSGYQSEIADAFGVRTNYGVILETILIEVKVSRKDFLQDSKKPFRIHPDKGMGNYRYYLVPEGLITIDELPLGWGLIEVNPKGTCKVIKGHVLKTAEDHWFTANRDKELTLCSWLLSKISDAEKLAKERQKLVAENNMLRNRLEQLLK